MEPEDEDKFNSLSSPLQPPVDATHDTEKPVADMHQGQDSDGGCGDVSQYPETVLPVDENEAVQDGSETVRPVQEVEKFSDFEDKDKGIETEEVGRSTEGNTNPVLVEGKIEEVEVKAVDVVEELTVAGEVESTEMANAGGEVAMKEGPADEAAGVAEKLENMGTELKDEVPLVSAGEEDEDADDKGKTDLKEELADVASYHKNEYSGLTQELGNMREEELVREESVDDEDAGMPEQLENMGKEELKEEAVDGVEGSVLDRNTEIEPKPNLTEGLEGVGNTEEELVLGRKVEANENIDEAEETKQSNVNVREDAKMFVVDEANATEEMEEEKVENREALDLPEETEGAEQDKLTDKAEETEEAEQDKLTDNTEETETEVAEESGDVNERDEIGDAEMADREEERENEEEMESAEVGEEAEMAEEGEKMKEAEEMEMAEETEGAEEGVSRSASWKRKRGKSAKAPSKPSSRRKSEEDVCFICFDGGNLVLCDRRGCPKAYHPSCVNRDEAFFQTKGRWNCGWHLCSNCQKNAYYMCYTCTFSLCKGCIKDAVFFCVRGNKGFCETCMKTVTMIEKSEQGNTDTVDFNDKSSWEYLFKDYWTDLKGRLALTSEEIAQAKIPSKGIDLQSGKQGLSEDLHDANNDGGSGSDSSSGDAVPTASKRRKASKRLKSRAKARGSQRISTLTEGDYKDGSVEWASKELLKFVAHMKNGDKSVCSQFDVQALLLEYIKRNKLRDPRRKSQIICDSRLESLFGKPRVGHFEMLKLLESHFLLKEDSQGDDLQGSVVDNESNLLETDGSPSMKMSKDKKRKSRKKGRGLQSNLDDYAGIDLHNINLIYLRRSLLENLLEDTETFHEKVVGSFVRIRISGNAQKQDLYRLVQVVGTSKAGEPYKVGKKMTEYVLEILNLNKTELVSIDIISNQDFTEDECKRLRQSIKCGLIKRLTVGDIQEKALALQAVRVEDLLESEVTRLSHLRDRASDLGKRKDLRECVEKLQLLKSPEERQRRLEEIPEIHADPNMDPSIESEEDEDEADDKRQESFLRPRGSAFSRRGREPVSPVKGGFASNDSWTGIKNLSSSNRELSRSMSNKGFSNKADDAVKADEILNENLWSHGREKEPQVSQTWEKSKTASNSEPRSTHSLLSSETVPRGMSEMSPTHPSIGVAQSALKINESDKIWHYRDPSGKIQGPFSMVQLRKWNNTGYFPTDLRIWRTTEKQDDSIILTNALNGNFQKETSSIENSSLKTQMIPEPHASPSLLGRAGESWKSQPEIGNSAGQAASSMVSVPNNSTDRWGLESSLPSPTPARTATGATKGQLYESKWSPTPTQPADNGTGANPFSRGSRDLQHPGAIRESGSLSHTSLSSSAGINMSHDAQMHSQSEVPNDSLRGQVNSHPHHGPDSSGGTANATIDMKSLQNLVQPIAGNKPLVGTLGWGPATVSKPEMNPSNTLGWSGSQSWGNTSSQKQELENSMSMPAQPNAYGNWSNAPPSVPNSTSSLSTGNPTGISPVPGPSSSVPSGPWRAPVPGQSNVPPSILSNMPWGAGVADNKSGAQRQGVENQVTGWGPIPGNTTVGWGGPMPTNPNQGWVAPGQGPAPGITNMGWGTPTQGQVPGNTNSGWVGPVAAQTPGTAYQAWAPPAQGSAQMNANPAWGAPSHGPSPANANPSWGAHVGNEKNKGLGDRFSGQRDRGSQGRDSGYGENKPWNRQSSFGNRGGDSSRPPYKGQRICKYHESGHCKKGAQCDYLHT